MLAAVEHRNDGTKETINTCPPTLRLFCRTHADVEDAWAGGEYQRRRHTTAGDLCAPRERARFRVHWSIPVRRLRNVLDLANKLTSVHCVVILQPIVWSFFSSL